MAARGHETYARVRKPRTGHILDRKTNEPQNISRNTHVWFLNTSFHMLNLSCTKYTQIVWVNKSELMYSVNPLSCPPTDLPTQSIPPPPPPSVWEHPQLPTPVHACPAGDKPGATRDADDHKSSSTPSAPPAETSWTSAAELVQRTKWTLNLSAIQSNQVENSFQHTNK